jgi:hypothetical protein
MLVPNERFSILTPDGFKPFFGIKQTFQSTRILYNQFGLRLLEATPDHQVLTPTGLKTIAALAPGDQIWGQASVETVAHICEGVSQPVYDPVDVQSDEHLYYSGRAISHNCSFMGSANTLIPAAKLSVMSYSEPKRTFWNGDLKIYHEPARLSEDGPSHVYLLTIDVSQGQEQNFSVVNVTDLSEMPWKQVAVYRNNKVSPQMLAPIVRDMAMMYNNAYVFIEINVEGQIVANALVDDMEYDNLITVKPHPKRGQMLSSGFNPQSRLGLKVTEATKKGGCAALKGLIVQDKYVISDFDTLRELTTYVAHNKSFAADEGCTDDIVATMVLLGWLSAQTGFENYVGLSMRQLMARGHEAMTFDDPIQGFLTSQLGPTVIGHDPQGRWDIVEDENKDFWG